MCGVIYTIKQSAPCLRWFRNNVYTQRVLLTISIVSTSLLFGDGVLTPAVSVISAVSGLEVRFVLEYGTGLKSESHLIAHLCRLAARM